MASTSEFIKNIAGRFGKLLSSISNIFDSEDPIIILPYRGYASEAYIFLKGRVIENEDFFQGKSEQELSAIAKSYRRFATDEIANTRIRIEIADQKFEVITDEEGYFTLDSKWTAPEKKAENSWLKANLTLMPSQQSEEENIVTAEAEIYLPSKNAEYGVITDVDNTVLESHVNSRFKWKMLFVTFFRDVNKRIPMEGMVNLFRSLVTGGDGKKENPIFYVSHSPWNIYDMLESFLAVQEFPKGPILLRDYGLKLTDEFWNHKINSISNILKTYPHLPFVLLGDSAEKDIDFYLQLAREFPNQIKTIYIRKLSDNKNARRIEKLIEEHSNINVVFAANAKEMLTHAQSSGLVLP